MNRPLDLTQRQIRALCEGAKKAGYVPLIEIGKTLIRLVPSDKLPMPGEKPRDEPKGDDFRL
jgi:hypothetical protein